MPVLKNSRGSIAQKSSSTLAHQLQAFNANIYLVLAILAVLAVARLIKLRLQQPHTTLPPLPASHNNIEKAKNNHSHTFPAASPPPSDQPSHLLSSSSWPWLRDKLGGVGLQSGLVNQLQRAVWAAKPLPFSPQTGLLRPFGRFGQLPTMGGTDGDQLEDHSGSASRGVSTNAAGSSDLGHQHDSEGDISKRPRRKFKGPMLDPTSHTDGIWSATYDGEPNASTNSQLNNEGLAQIGFSLNTVDSTTQRHSAFPPPPSPLGSSTMSDVGFPFQDRRPSYAVSIPPELDTSFISQTNLEYDASSTSANVQSTSPQSSNAIPRRRSYTRSIPIPITSSASSTESMTSGTTFSPSSYPPSSPLLPPPPPVNDAPPDYVFVGGPGGPGVFLEEREIDIHDEIISVMDEESHGWKRHTRVYGSNGACLACLSSEDQGGFYGDKVPLSDRR